MEAEGSVYIYNGRKDWNDASYQQKIMVNSFKNDELENKLKSGTFGWSITGSYDMNDDGFLDISVGAYESDTVITLFGRPILNPQLTIEDLVAFDPKTDQTVKVNFKVELTITDSVDSKFHYEVIEVPLNNMPRRFKPKQSAKGDIKISPTANSQEISVSFELSDAARDLMNPVEFKVELSSSEPTGVKVSELKGYPILNEKMKSKTVKMKFNTGCSQYPCQSDLKTEIELNLPASGQNEEVYIFDSRNNNLVTANITVTNNGENAFDPITILKLPQSFQVNQIISGICSAKQNETYECSWNSPMQRNERNHFIIKLRYTGDISLDYDKITASSTTISSDIDSSNNIAEKKIRITLAIDVSLNGSITPKEITLSKGTALGADAIKKTDQIGDLIKATFFLRNNGNHSVSGLSIRILTPFEVKPHPDDKNGKYLLYLESVSKKDCTIEPADAVNQMNYIIANRKESSNVKLIENKKRKKRQVFNYDIEDYGRSRISKDSLTIGCPKLGARCAVITCKFDEIKPSMSEIVNVYSRLWNSTFVMDYQDYKYVRISTFGHFFLQTNKSIDINPNDNQVYLENEIRSDVEFRKKEFPLWIIIVSAIAGIVILLIIILLFYLCGFFKRDKPDEMFMHSGKKTKNIQENF